MQRSEVDLIVLAHNPELWLEIQRSRERIGRANEARKPVKKLSLWRRFQDFMHKFLPILLTATILQAEHIDQVLDVRQFGAKGNGFANDAAAIQSAVNAAQDAGGGVVWIPIGTFLTGSTQVTITEDNVTIACANGGSRIKYTGNGSAIRFVGTGGVSGAANIGEGNGVQNCHFDGLAAGPVSIGIELENQNNFKAENVNGQGFKFFNKQSGANLFRTLFHAGSVGYQFAGGSAFWIAGGADAFFADIAVSNSPDAAWLITKSGGFTIKSASVLFSGDGLRLAPTGNDQVLWGFVSDSMFDTGTRGVAIVPTGNGKVSGVSFANSWTSSNLMGVDVAAEYPASASGITFAAHRAVNNQRDGMSFAGTGTEAITVAAGSMISGNSASRNGAYPGIRLGSGVHDVTIKDNYIGLISGVVFAGPTSFKHSVGIMFEPGVGSGLNISGNTIKDYAVAPIYGISNFASTGGYYAFRDNNPDSLAVLTVASNPSHSIFLGEAPVERVILTGTDSTATMTPAWEGRRVSVVASSEAPGGVIAGGNFARAFPMVQGGLYECLFQAGGWYCR